MPFRNNKSYQSRLMIPVMAVLLSIPLSFAAISIAEAQVTKCKIKVVGGSFKGRSFNIEMKDGKFTNVSGMQKSELAGCRVKKKVYGRWYHLCKKGTLIVYKRKNFAWKRLSDKSLLKYQHTCF
ncbi:MAG TPA: hypothetical protein ENJ55_06060 [Rhizobiales bacterium]|nr:hypothetical protein [Hyphomicrobiales bacterium]